MTPNSLKLDNSSMISPLIEIGCCVMTSFFSVTTMCLVFNVFRVRMGQCMYCIELISNVFNFKTFQFISFNWQILSFQLHTAIFCNLLFKILSNIIEEWFILIVSKLNHCLALLYRNRYWIFFLYRPNLNSESLSFWAVIKNGVIWCHSFVLTHYWEPFGINTTILGGVFFAWVGVLPPRYLTSQLSQLKMLLLYLFRIHCCQSYIKVTFNNNLLPFFSHKTIPSRNTLPMRQVGPPGLWQPDHIIVPVRSPKDLSGSQRAVQYNALVCLAKDG